MIPYGFWPRLAISAVVIIGIWNLFAPGMLLSLIGDLFERHARYIGKPLALCLPCMASVHGCWLYLLLGGHWYDLPIFCLALSGVLVLVSRILFRNG